MSAYAIMEASLKEILSAIQPSQDDLMVRHNIVAELRPVVESVESLRGATLEPFGSFVSNLFTRWGDLDLSIDLPNGSYFSTAGKKRKEKVLGDLWRMLRMMRMKGAWGWSEYIPNARVPVLKFRRRNISCDISINNVQGQIKSKFLYWICEIDGRFRDIVLLVKEWAKATDINNPKAGTFNSYSLSLLVIFHFQTCMPKILPPFKDIYPGNLVDDLTGVRIDAERRIAETCATNIARFRSDQSRTINRSSLSELLISFFEKFSGLSLKASQLAVCPFTGQWEALNSKPIWMDKTNVIFVEDPLEKPENTGRSVSAKELTRISETFERTHRKLLSMYHSRSDILATLARPNLLSAIPIIPVRSYHTRRPLDHSTTHSNNSYPESATSPQDRTLMHSPSQLQHQFQNMSLRSPSRNVIIESPARPYPN